MENKREIREISGATAVYLISGFLGSGKTTFLNRIIREFPEDQKLMILMNEFGDIGVDGFLVEDDDIAMLEISKGSIFCVCVKTDFIRGLMDIAQNLQPDVLIIEATGVANPSDLKRDLKLSIFQNRFQLKEQFCIIDAENFEDAYDTFTSIEKQIENATVFIINKIDLVDEKIIGKVKQIIGKHHPNPEFYETVHAKIPFGKYLPEITPWENDTKGMQKQVSPRELDAFINGRLADPMGAMMPPDRLLSVTYTWMEKDYGLFEEMVKKIPGKMVRAKGIFNAGNETYLFNYVMGRGAIEKIDGKESMTVPMNRIVFIGPPETIEMMEHIDFNAMLKK